MLPETHNSTIFSILPYGNPPKYIPTTSFFLLSRSPLGFLLLLRFFWEMSLPSIKCINVTDNYLLEWKNGNPNFKVSGTVFILYFLHELCSTLVRFFFHFLPLFICLFYAINDFSSRNMCSIWMLGLGLRCTKKNR